MTQDELRAARIKRANEFAALYREGKTLHEIGLQYNLTRERVRQLLAEIGISRQHGGVSKKVADARTCAKAKKDLRYLKNYGCTYAEYLSIRDSHRKNGKTPLYYFIGQRRNAATRNIEWHLTLTQWWALWQASGKWNERGRGDGYVMARNNDTGPYSADNVRIVHAVANILEYYEPTNGTTYHATRKKWGMDYDPSKLTVKPSRKGPKGPKSSAHKGVSWHKRDRKWIAFIGAGRNQVHLGSFETEQQAAQAVAARVAA